MSTKLERLVGNAQERVGDFAFAEPGTLPVVAQKQAARLIDHTLLKPDATSADIIKLCGEAAEYGFASVCVNPTWVGKCRERLLQSDVAVCTVVGFPLGATLADVKRYEAQAVVENGATEVDMVLNVGKLRDGEYAAVLDEIARVVEVVHAAGRIVKVILETCLLNRVEIGIAAALCVEANADFVKTSTGFSTGGATTHDVALLRHIVGDAVGVKASGGIRTAEDLRKMVAVGASRIGASAGVAIVSGLPSVGPQPTSDTGTGTWARDVPSTSGEEY